MLDFEFEKGSLQDNFVAVSQACLSAIDPGRALLQKLRHSSHIVEDLASLYTTHPSEYAKIMCKLRVPLGDAKVRRLHTSIQAKLKAADKAESNQEEGSTEGGETHTYETSVFDHPVNIAVTEEAEGNTRFDVSTKDLGSIQQVSGHAAFKDGKFRDASLQANFRISDTISATGGLALHRDERGKLRPSAKLGTSVLLDKLVPGASLDFSLEATPDGVSRQTDLHVDGTTLSWKTPSDEQDEAADKHNTQTDAPQTDATEQKDATHVSDKAADTGKSDQTTTGNKGMSAKSGDGAKEVSMPSGGGVPTLIPKGEGSGANATETFINSGTSYQIEHYGALGAKLTQELQKVHVEMEASLPGEAGVEINDGKADSQLNASMEATRMANGSLKASKFDSSIKTVEADTFKAKVQAQKQAVTRASEEEFPNAPVIEADDSAIKTVEVEGETKYAEAMNEFAAKIGAVNTTIDKYDFNSLHTPKAKLEADADAINTENLTESAAVAALSDEAKALLDDSEFAKTSLSQMEVFKAQAAEAETKRKADTDAAIAEHDKGIATEIERANQTEQELIAQHQAELDTKMAEQMATYEGELNAANAEQREAILEAQTKLEAEKAKAQAKVDQAFSNSKKEKEKVEKEGEEKEKKGFFERVGDVVSSAVSSLTSWLKEKVSGIVKLLKNVVCAALDAYVAVVSRINKELGDKYKKVVDKFKGLLDKLAQDICDRINNVLDSVAQAVQKIVEDVTEAIQQHVDDLSSALQGIWEGIKSVMHDVKTGIGAVLESLTDTYFAILKTACVLVGADPSIIDKLREWGEKVVNNPGGFFSALGRGVIEGFNLFFFRNWEANFKAVGVNLFNIWLGKADLSLPDFSTAGLIKFGLELIGVDVNSILKSLGLKETFEAFSQKTSYQTPWDERTKVREDRRLDLEIQKAEAKVEEAEANLEALLNNKLNVEDQRKIKREQKELEDAKLKKNELIAKKEESVQGAGDLSSQKEMDTGAAGFKGLVNELHTKGISALIPYIQEHVGDLASDVLAELGKSLTQVIAKKFIAKLALMTTPVGGIVAAIKAVWDLIQFVRSNMKEISSLAEAILDCLGGAANGESAYVAAAVEATLCQAVPLVFEMIFRLLGIDFGGMIKGFVDKHIRGRIQRILDKIISTFRSSGNRMVSAAANKVMTSQEREDKKERTKRKKQEVKNRRLAGAESGNKADKLGLWAINSTERLDAKKKTQKKSAFHVTGLTSAFNGEREGSLGVSLDHKDED